MLVYTLTALAAVAQFPPNRPPGTPQTGAPGQASTPQRQPRTRSATGDALDRYARGDYASAVSLLSSLGGFNVQQADTWILASGPEAAPRRRLIAATLVLEVVAAKSTWPSQVVEWACNSFRTPGSSGAGAELWMRASIALAEGYRVWPFLTVAPFRRGLPTNTSKQAIRLQQLATEHLSHGRERFPDNPYVALAEVVVAENLTLEPDGAEARPTDQTPVALDRLTVIVEPVTALSASQRALLEQAAGVLADLQKDQAVGGEAALRLGFVRLRLGDRSAALARFGEAPAIAKDEAVRYLARFFEAWALARDEQTDAAMASYRAALSIMPRARSASTLLVSLLLRNDRLEDAEALGVEFLRVPNQSPDPWAGYLQGDYRNYGDLLAQLRKAIQ